MVKVSILIAANLVLVLATLAVSFRHKRAPKPWRSLATCLQMPPKSTAKSVLREIASPRKNLIVSLTSQPSSRPSLVNSPPVRTKACPFTYQRDDNPKRLPRYLSKAVCPGCNRFCEALEYSVPVLEWRCENVWVQSQEKVSVAFF